MQFLIQDFQTHISLGVYPIEKRIRNKVLITISFYYDTVNAEVSDQLKDTIDYDCRLMDVIDYNFNCNEIIVDVDI